MRFFTDYAPDKSECIGVTSLLSNITDKPHSHKGGWARLLICQLKNLGYEYVKIVEEDELSHDYSALIFDLGAEFSGGFNLFGGVDANVFKRLEELRQFKGRLFSWKHELPDVGILAQRIGNASNVRDFDNGYQGKLQEIVDNLKRCQVFDHAVETRSLLICDSHGPAVWTPEFMIDRRDGRTLRGMLERSSLVRHAKEYQHLEKVQAHVSSIDIRHHVCRTTNPLDTTVSLALGLVRHIQESFDGLDAMILTHTMGIEDESRKLPKTGYFKGSPFYGSWLDRNRCRLAFNEIMEDQASQSPIGFMVAYPPVFFDKQDKLRFEVLEKPQSVHISPEHYRWDLEKNVRRWPW